MQKKAIYIVATVLLLALAFTLFLSAKKKDDKPADPGKKPDDGGKKPAGDESGYLLTGLKCTCRDEFGNVYYGDELLLADGSKVCLCPDYFALYGYPWWWGGYYSWRWPGRRWRGHGGGHGPVHHAPAAPPAPMRVRPVTTGMRMGGGGMRGGMGGGGFGGGGGRGGRR